MSFYSILRAEYKLVYSEMIRRRSALIAMILYPYLFAGFTLFFGYTMGSAEIFSRRIGVDPVIFMITASYTVMSVLASVDDVLWRPLSDTFIGTLPYIIASPVSRLKLYLAIPIPRLTALIVMGFTSIIPVYTAYYGLEGLLSGLVVMGLITLGCLTMITLAMVIAGLVHTIGESWRVLNIVRPLVMILLGAYYPRIYMPLIGYVLSSLIPSSHIVEVIHNMLRGELSNFYILIALAIALAVLYAPGGNKSILYWEKKKVREGVKTD
ncbi:MAG: ABC transporter permease [Thermoprotei archaeon]|nr:MAG: ABC transporter permease [Thermoprotei archaeon]